MSELDLKEPETTNNGYVGPLALTGAVVTIGVWGIEEFFDKVIPGEVVAAITTVVYAGVLKFASIMV